MRAYAFLVVLAVGCGGIDLDALTEADRVTVEDELIEMPVGLAVAVRVADADVEDDTSRMTSTDETVVAVGATTAAHQYIVYGVSTGETVLEVHINDELKGEVDAVIVAY
jgi:hypothetical protein